MYGNYRYSLTSEQQQRLQLFLRFLPPEIIKAVERAPFVGEGTFQLLHDLTYAESWTKEPQYEVADSTIKKST